MGTISAAAAVHPAQCQPQALASRPGFSQLPLSGVATAVLVLIAAYIAWRY